MRRKNELSEQTVTTVTTYWASHLGCTVSDLFARPLHTVAHGSDLADYDGVLALFRGEAATVSFPPNRIDSLGLLLTSPLTPSLFAKAFGDTRFTIIGPAYVGYADVVDPPSHPVRSLIGDDARALDSLRANCTEIEWDHAGFDVGDKPSSGVFVNGQLVALAGYKVWGSSIAHIYIITDPAFRGRKFGRSAVAHLANKALAAGLVPQYRTLFSNEPAIRLAESLGFCHYATSVAVRLNSASQQLED